MLAVLRFKFRFGGFIFLIAFLLSLQSCVIGQLIQYRFSDEYQPYDRNNKHYLEKNSPQCEWYAQTDTSSYLLSIDSSAREIHLFGKFIVNQHDTFLIHTFEKGSQYPTWYWSPTKGKNGLFFLRFNDVNSDSLWFDARQDSIFSNMSLLFLRRPRN